MCRSPDLSQCVKFRGSTVQHSTPLTSSLLCTRTRTNNDDDDDNDNDNDNDEDAQVRDALAGRTETSKSGLLSCMRRLPTSYRMCSREFVLPFPPR